MPAPISVIIPTLNSADQIGPVIACLAQGLNAGLIRELIIADGGSADDIESIADDLGAEFLRTKPGRGIQLAAAARQARGEWLLVLHADSLLDPAWVEAVQAHLASGKAGYFRLVFDDTALMARIAAGWANLRAGMIGLPFGDQGLLVPRRLYDKVGGYPEIPLMEDVALARALRGHFRAIPATIVTSAARYRQQGWLRRGAGNLWLQLRFLLGAKPERLAAEYAAGGGEQ